MTSAVALAAPPSPAGPLDDIGDLTAPPAIPLPRWTQILRYTRRHEEFVFRARRELGEVFRRGGRVGDSSVVTCHPEHVKSLFTADPDSMTTLATESPLRPIVGPNSVLTANGPRHMRQRKLLLPAFHGEAIAQYTQLIADATEHEIGRWPIGRPFSLAPRMQAITLDVILAGIFGITGRPRAGTPEHFVRAFTRSALGISTWRVAQLPQLLLVGSGEPTGPLKAGMSIVDRALARFVGPLLDTRRADPRLAERRDILSLLLHTRTEDGELLTDDELRDELITLVLAGHETTANQLAWTFERLVRTPDAYDALREAVRSGDDVQQHVDAALTEGMRVRPVIPAIGRRVASPWRLGDYGVPAGTAIEASVLLLHHRDDLYPDPHAFRPERWRDRKPGTYEWIPFGGGTRRCLGAAFAMAEQRIVLEAVTRRLDLEPADPDSEPAMLRNVTLIPAAGARVVARRAA